MNSAFRFFGLVLVGFVLGFLFGHFGRTVFELEWDKSFGLEIVSNLFSAIIIAVILQQAYQKRFSETQIEKDLVRGYLREALQNLGAVRQDFIHLYRAGLAPATSDPQVIVGRLKSFSMSITAAIDFMDTLGYSSAKETCEGIKTDFHTYKHFVSGGEFPTAKYDNHANRKQEEFYGKISKSLIKTIAAITRA
jgi:hypothetical protein